MYERRQNGNLTYIICKWCIADFRMSNIIININLNTFLFPLWHPQLVSSYSDHMFRQSPLTESAPTKQFVLTGHNACFVLMCFVCKVRKTEKDQFYGISRAFDSMIITVSYPSDLIPYNSFLEEEKISLLLQKNTLKHFFLKGNEFNFCFIVGSTTL